MDAGPWNWLELAKLCASLLVPITLAVFGVYIHRITKRFEHTQWRSQKLIEKRLAIYDDLAPLLNDLLCYFTYVGSWKEANPPDVVALKRVIDKKIYLAAPLCSQEFFSACMELQSLCFSTFNGWGRNAGLRTQFFRRKEARAADWQVEWESCFSEEVSKPVDIQKAHHRVMEAFSKDIGVYGAFVVPAPGSVPANIV